MFYVALEGLGGLGPLGSPHWSYGTCWKEWHIYHLLERGPTGTLVVDSVYRGWHFLPSYIGIIIISHYKDPYESSSIMESRMVFFVAQIETMNLNAWMMNDNMNDIWSNKIPWYDWPWGKTDHSSTTLFSNTPCNTSQKHSSPTLLYNAFLQHFVTTSFRVNFFQCRKTGASYPFRLIYIMVVSCGGFPSTDYVSRPRRVGLWLVDAGWLVLSTTQPLDDRKYGCVLVSDQDNNSVEQCSKPWLAVLYRGLYYPLIWGL